MFFCPLILANYCFETVDKSQDPQVGLELPATNHILGGQDAKHGTGFSLSVRAIPS
jgi:hypothetical protein